jgi:hypothetical protein
MPTLSIYDPQKLCDIAQTEITTRQVDISKRVAYADGDQTRFLVNPKTKQPTNENVIINVSGKIINQTVSFLVGDQPEIKHPDDAVSALIESIEDFNQDDIFYTGMAEEGSISGHVFVKLCPDEAGNIAWEIQTSEIVTAFWEPRNKKKAVAYMVKWSEGEIEYRQDIIKNSLMPENTKPDFWTVFDLEKSGKQGQWIITSTTEWDYPFSPMVDWQNLPNRRSFYGKSDLRSIDLNDNINFTASNIGRILKFHAHPKTVLTGGTPDSIKQTSVDGLWAIDSDTAKVFNLEMQSDLSSSLNYLHELRGAFFSEQGAVDLDSFKDKVGSLTNFGLRVLFNDALAKNNTKQQLYEYGIKELVYRSLCLMGTVVNAKDIDVEFSNPLPENELENVQVVKTELEAGTISQQTGSEELGHDWEQEKLRMAEEKQSASGDLGALLAEAMRKEEIQTNEGDLQNA